VKFVIDKSSSKLILKESSREEYNQLKRILNPYVKNYKHMTRYKLGVWNGKIDHFHDGRINIGLWKTIYDTCQEYGYPFIVENKDKFPRNNDIKYEDVVKFCNEFFDGYKTADGEIFSPYEHQMKGVFKFLKYKYGLEEIATAGGKSLAFSILIFYILKYINKDAKFLLIVPTISLVTQFYDDILDYNEGYNKEQKNPFDLKIQEIMSDKPRKMRDNIEPNIYIGTYQSLEKYSKKFFKQFYLVAVDEGHHAKAKSFVKILEKTFDSAEYRIGFSGTFPEKNSAEMLTIESLTGPILMTVNADELIKKGLISNLKIKALILQHEDKSFASNVYSIKKRGAGKKAYELEKKYSQNSQKRLAFISKLTDRFKQNSLILFHNIEYGVKIYDYLRSNCIGKDIYYIDGTIDAKTRNRIKKIMEDTSGNVKILVASYGTLSTGINIKAINNIIFADSFRSPRIVRQSIGRGLRLHVDKEKLIVFDLVDQFHHAYKGTLYNHYLYRRDKIYIVQNFPLDEIKIII